MPLSWEQLAERLNVELTQAATSFPPGTDARLSTNILETAGLDLTAVRDEPSCVASLRDLDKAAMVDVGGGTCCLPGIDKIFFEELGIPVQLPSQPLLLTPLAIASLPLSKRV
jgi:Ethanolamine utilization protein EutJ (predicted chaperonin)